MAESSSDKKGTDGAAGGAAPEQHISLRHLYVKDLSFEAPLMPEILAEKGPEPDIRLNLRTTHRDLPEGMTEVVLHVEVRAVVGERTFFLLELAQAGRFQITGFSEEDTDIVIGIDCPGMLFPYAREAVSSLIQRGGFPSVLLYPEDFAFLYRAKRTAKAKAASSQT
jgi:preprotein translocase subunit SecB